MLRILHISDTQLADGSEEKQIVDFALAEKVDLLIHTGDLLDRKKRPTPDQATEIITNKLKVMTKLPLIIIPGNHDPESFRNKSEDEKKQTLAKTISLFRNGGALVPDHTSMSLTEEISLTSLNRLQKRDFLYGISVADPILEPVADKLNLAIAHGVGYVPYHLVFSQQMDWERAVELERRDTYARLRSIIELGYDIILCGHHRHSNVSNGLFHHQQKIVSLRGQQNSADKELNEIADCGTFIEIRDTKIEVNTVKFTPNKIIWDKGLEELDHEN